MTPEQASNKLDGHSNIPIKKVRKVKCPHSHDTGNGVATAINPYSGKCILCGEQIDNPKEESPTIDKEYVIYDSKGKPHFPLLLKIILGLSIGSLLVLFYLYGVDRATQDGYSKWFEVGVNYNKT